MLAATNISEKTQLAKFAKYNSTPKFVDLQYLQCQGSAERANADVKYMLVSTRVYNNRCGSWIFSFLLTYKAVGLVEFNNFCRAVGILLTKVF